MAVPVGSPLYAVVDDIVNAAGSPDPLARIRAVLGDHTN